MNAWGSWVPGVCLLGLLLSGPLLGGRTWTTVEGGTTDGDLLSFKEGKVTLLIAGREYIFPVSRFSASDRAYLLKWKKELRCGVCRKTVGHEKMQAGEEGRVGGLGEEGILVYVHVLGTETKDQSRIDYHSSCNLMIVRQRT